MPSLYGFVFWFLLFFAENVEVSEWFHLCLWQILCLNNCNNRNNLSWMDHICSQVTLRYTMLHYVTLQYDSKVTCFSSPLKGLGLRSPASLSMSLSTGHRCRRDVFLDLPGVSIGSCCPSWWSLWSPRSWESVWIFAHFYNHTIGTTQRVVLVEILVFFNAFFGRD